MKLGDVCVAIMLCLALFVLSGCGKQDEVEKRAPAQVEVTEEPSSSDSEEEPSSSDSEEEPVEEGIQDAGVFLDMQGADFSPFDNKIVYGPDVVNALRIFRNSNVAVLVATQMVMDGTEAPNRLDGNVDPDMPTAAVTGITGAVKTSGEDLSDKLTFINYGALLKDPTGEGVVLEYKDGYILAKDGLMGDEQVNLKDANTVKDGYSENIADYLHMRAYLVKDADGKVIGIAFHAVPSEY